MEVPGGQTGAEDWYADVAAEDGHPDDNTSVDFTSGETTGLTVTIISAGRFSATSAFGIDDE